MKPLIEICGPNVVLREMTREDYHAVRRLHEPDPLADAEMSAYDPKWVDAKYDAMSPLEDWLFLGIFTRDQGIIGEMAFKRIDRDKNRCELGISLAASKDKGKGYGGEAFALATEYALNILGVRAVYADTMGGNMRMRRILERLGYRCFLRMEACYSVDGRWEDRLDFIKELEESKKQGTP